MKITKELVIDYVMSLSDKQLEERFVRDALSLSARLIIPEEDLRALARK